MVTTLLLLPAHLGHFEYMPVSGAQNQAHRGLERKTR
jgi:hypothetical protein